VRPADRRAGRGQDRTVDDVPEIAEVETLRRQLVELGPLRVDAVQVSGRRTVRAHPPGVLDALVGGVLDSVHRRGKWLALSGTSPAGPVGVRLHLRMSGRLHWHAAGDPVEPHTHVVLGVNGHELRFVDPRTFGEVAWWDGGELGTAAPDALDDDVDVAWAIERLRRRTSPIKQVLLDQAALVQGVGNIYADEICHRAGIAPTLPADRLGRARVVRLLDAVGQVLPAAVEHRGTALVDEGWRDLHGELGEHGGHLLVHTRTVCGSCGSGVSKGKVAGRSTYWCRRCQPQRRVPA
jgi:formamidopyrimidine-DNA glycosylase